MFQWEVREAGVQLAIQASAIEELETDLATRGASSRGLLLGRWSEAGHCTISNSIPLTGAEAGASRTLAEACEELEDVLEGWRSSPTLPAPVGVYARVTGDADCFCQEQIKPISKYMIGPASFVMCAPWWWERHPRGRSSGTGACETVKSELVLCNNLQGIIARTQFVGHLNSRRSVSPAKAVTSNDSTLQRQEQSSSRSVPLTQFEADRTLPAPTPRTKSATASHDSVEVAGADSPPRKEKWRRVITWAVAVAALTAIAVMSVSWWTSKPQAATAAQGTALPPTNQHPPVLGLTAQLRGDDLVINWRASGIVDTVHSSSLYISDGSRRTHILLEPSQRTIGGVVYSPQFAKVAIELQIATVGDKLVRESIVIDAARRQQTTSAGVVSPLPTAGSPELPKEDAGVKLPQ